MKRDWHTMDIDELSAILQAPPTLVDAELALCELGDRIRLRELTEIPEDIHQLLVEHLGAPDPVVQLEAAIVLAELADTRAISVLVSATKKRKHRLEALRAMAKIKTSRYQRLRSNRGSVASGDTGPINYKQPLHWPAKGTMTHWRTCAPDVSVASHLRGVQP